MDSATSGKSPLEKKVKIHLPISYQQASNCSEEKKEKILLSQAKRIGHLQEWEIKALLRLCNDKEQEEGKKGNWLKKGMAILFEYAGSLDQYWDIIGRINDIKNPVPITLESFFSNLTLASYLLAKIFSTVCNLRRLQATPRVISTNLLKHVDENAALSPHSVDQSLRDTLKSRMSLLLGESHELAVSCIRSVCGYMTLDQLIIVCAPIMSFEQFIDLAVLDTEQGSSTMSDETDLELWDLEEDSDSIASMFAHLTQFFKFESNIDELESKSLLSNQLPTLRLPYIKDRRSRSISNENATEKAHVAWFKDAIPTYGELGKLLISKLEAHSIVKTKPFPVFSPDTPAKLRSLKRHFSENPYQPVPLVAVKKVEVTPTNNRVLQQEVQQLLHDRKKQIASLKVPVGEHAGEQSSNNELSTSPAQGMLAKHPALLQIQSPTFNAFTPSPKFRSFPNTNDTSGGKEFSYQSGQKGLASPSSHLLAMPHRNTPQQALKNALRTVYSDDPLSPSIAATKISIWWRFLIPRRRLAFRMQRRTAVRVIIWEVVELSMHKSNLRYKRRHRMLRNGAATKIQRWVRRKVLNRYGRLPGSSMHRHSGRSRSRSNSHVMISSSRNVEHDFGSHRSSSSQSSVPPTRKMRSIHAAVIIQTWIRPYLSRMRQLRVEKYNMVVQKIVYLICKFIIRRRRKKKKLLEAKMTVIQRHVRGLLTRKHLFVLVQAGVRINTAWREHLAYKAIKNRLRRIDRPITVFFKGIRNVPVQAINSGSLKIRLSVWWHPLLHIVSRKDMTAIVETKRPQLIYTSNAFTTTEEALKPVVGMQANSPGNNSKLRRLSTVNAMHRKMAKSILLSRQHEVNSLLPSALAQTPERQDAFSMLSRSRSSSEIGASNGSPPAVAKGGFSMLSRSRAASIMEEGEEDHHDEAVAVMNEFGLAPKSFIDVVKVARHSSKLQASTSRRSVEEEEAGESRKNSAVPLSPSSMLAAGTADEEQDSESSDSSNEDGDDTHNCYEGSNDNNNKTAAEALMRAFGDSPLRSLDGEGNHNSSVRKKLSGSLEMSKTIGRTLSQEKLGIPPDDQQASPSKSADGNKAVPNIMRRVRSSITKMGESLVNGVMRRSSDAGALSKRLQANFNNLTVKIPGCHGNSVFKFEVFDGDRKFASSLFYLNGEGAMLYWGGEYEKELNMIQQRKGGLRNTAGPTTHRHRIELGPILDFKVVCGAALRSRCQFARVAIRGNGLLTKTMSSEGALQLILFHNWNKFFLSLDEFGLHLFESKYTSETPFSIHVSDFREVKITLGRPSIMDRTHQEDLRNVVLQTYSGDEITLRFSDKVSTNSWLSCIQVAILYAHEKSKDLRLKRRSFTDLSRKSSWLPGVLRSSSNRLFGGLARKKKGSLPALLHTAAQRFLSKGGNRLAAADDEESIEEKSDGPEDGDNSDDENGNDKGEAEDAEKEAMMSTYTGRRSRRYLAPILEPGSRRSLAELPQQFSVSQKLREFIS